jgi:hypothetical protein
MLTYTVECRRFAKNRAYGKRADLTLNRSFTIASIAFLFFVQAACAKIDYPNFDQSMLRPGLEKTDPSDNRRRLEDRNQELASFFREKYYQNIEEAANEKEGRIRIPRIVHQIWLGSPVPEVFRKWMDTWTRLEGWEYKLWTDEETRNLSMYNQALYDEVTQFVEKSDILRLELLSQFGGVYVDTDFECLNPEAFEELHRSFDFYIGFEPLEHGHTEKFNMFKVCNAILASAPEHPLVQDLIENLRANYLAHRKDYWAVQRTGPSYLTRIICQHETSGTDNKRNMYLPCTFFYPISEPESSYLFQHFEEQAIISPETAGIHYWWGTWWKSQSFTETIGLTRKNHPYQSE